MGFTAYGCSGLFEAVFGTLGAAHGAVLGPLRSGGLYNAAPLPFSGFDSKFEPSIEKTSGFVAWGCFRAVFGTHGGVQGPLSFGSLDQLASLPFGGLGTKFEHSILKTLGFTI